MAAKPKPAAVKTTAELLARRQCGSCYHFERYPDESQTPGNDIVGECLLYPPRVIDVDETGATIQAVPIRFFRDRCGQHQPQVN